MITATVLGDIALIIGGYVAYIYTWPKIKVIVNGAQTEVAKLRAKANALLAAIKS